MGDILNTLRANYRGYLLWALLFSLMIVPLGGSLIYLSIHEGDSVRPHVPELRQIADQIPVYPDFERTGDDYIVLKGTRASLQRNFRTHAQFAEIRKFYDAALANAGWGPPDVPPPSIIVGEQHYVIYHRGSYEFGVYQKDGRQNSYAIGVAWSAESKCCQSHALEIINESERGVLCTNVLTGFRRYRSS
jgi:hypothetical protein